MTTAIATATEAPDESNPSPVDTSPDSPANAVDTDGVIYNIATGEIVGLIGTPDDPDRPERFEVVDDAGVEWVLERIGRAEANALALEERKRAIVANLDRAAAQERNKADGLRYRYGPGIEEQARRRMERAGTKTAIYAHGVIKKYTVKGSTEIVDADAACEFVKGWTFDQVKFKPTVKAIEAAIAKATESNGGVPPEPAELSFVKYHGPSERTSIKTGVGDRFEASRGDAT